MEHCWKAYPASRAAPSAAWTRLVSSWEICRASARCMSVMVQNDATRWSGRGHNKKALINKKYTKPINTDQYIQNQWIQIKSKLSLQNMPQRDIQGDIQRVNSPPLWPTTQCPHPFVSQTAAWLMMGWIRQSFQAVVMPVLPHQALKLVQSLMENPNLACYGGGQLSSMLNALCSPLFPSQALVWNSR